MQTINELDPWFYDFSLLRWFFRAEIKKQLPLPYRLFAEFAAYMEQTSKLSRLKGGRYIHWLLLNLYKSTPLDRAFPMVFNDLKLFCDLGDPRFLLVLRELGNATQELDLLERLLEPGDSFIDVGANHGSFSMTASKKIGKTGCVVAVEPQPRLSELVKRSLALNAFCPAVVHSVACGEGEGPVDLFIPSSSSGMAGMFAGFSALSKAEKISVDLVGLDELVASVELPGKVLLKLDVEGAEYTVLKSASQLLENHHPLLMIEINPEAMVAAGTSASDLINILTMAGYTHCLEVTKQDQLRPISSLDVREYHNLLVVPECHRSFVESTIL